MNFFEHQERAKKKTVFLILCFFIAVISITCIMIYVLSVIYVGFLNSRYIGNLSPFEVFYFVPKNILSFGILAILIVIALGSIVKIVELSKGGSIVAEAIGGKLVSQNRYSKNIHETTLLNIVDEISIASGIPSPPVYIIEDNSINAFAAGNNYENAVIGVTRGAIEKLSREELQGVIAHEFSHIFNGDMKLNIRAVGILNGILFISLIGLQVLKSIRFVRSGNNRNSGGAILFILAVGGSLYILGSVGILFGNIIKASINRQREYLADANSIQFTRNPSGISSALKKIGAYGSEIHSPRANEFSHMYFSSGINSLLATHPPLNERIKRIDPTWDGNFDLYIKKEQLKTKSKLKQEEIKKEQKEKQNPKKDIASIITAAAILKEVEDIGNIDEIKIQKAQEEIQRIPLEIREFSSNPLQATFIIYSLLMQELSQKEQFMQIDNITDKYQNFLHVSNIKQTFIEVKDAIDKLNKKDYLNGINLTIPTLKMLSFEQYKNFREIVTKLIEYDKHISWFEWNMKYLVIHPLDVYFNLSKVPNETYNSMSSIKFEIEILLSFLAYSEHKSDERAEEALQKTNIRITKNIKFNYIDKENVTNSIFENSMKELERAKPSIRKEILEIAIILINEDDNISQEELQSIYALASILRLPVRINEIDN